MGWFTDMLLGTSPVIQQRQAEGFHLLYVDAGYTAGVNVPPHSTMLLKIAPLEQPLAAFALAPADGAHPAYFHIDDVERLHVSSNGATFFEFGPSAIVARSIAANLDRMLAGWSIEIALTSGDIIRATKVSGPPPDHDLVRLQSRIREFGQMS